MRSSPGGNQLSILNSHTEDTLKKSPIICTLRAGASSWTSDDVSLRRGVAFTSSPSSLSPSPSHSVTSNSIFPPLPQFLLITGTAFTVAEILNYFGFFHDENGNNAKRKTREYIDSKREHRNSSSSNHSSILEDIPEIVENWFQCEFNQEGGIFHIPTLKRRIEFHLNTGIEFLMNNKQNNVDEIAHKHQFAIGNVVGIISRGSPIMIFKVIAFTYVFSEVIHGFVSGPVYTDITGYQSCNKYSEYLREDLEDNNLNADDFFDQVHDLKTNLMQPLRFCNDKLRWIRIRIRLLLRSPMKGLEELLSTPWIQSNGAIITGFICGILIANLFEISK